MLTIIRTAAMLVVMLSILGCQTWQEQKKTTVEMKPAAARFDAGEYERISPEKGAVYWIDSDASEVRLFLWRGGPMASKGHNHVLVVRNLEGAVFVPNSMLEDDMRFDMVFQAADIEVDPPTHRKKIGGAFATEIPPEGIEGTRGNMLSERVLNAKKFPAVGLSAVQVYGEPPKMAVHTAVTLHGVERLYLVPATVEVNADRVSARGAFAIEQTDFGIKPMSVMGGALFVEDPIMIEFSLVGRPPSP